MLVVTFRRGRPIVVLGWLIIVLGWWLVVSKIGLSRCVGVVAASGGGPC